MTSLHQLLRARTAEAHERLEARLGILDPGLTRDRYVAILTVFRGVYAPLEARLRGVAPSACDTDRTRWLDEDLRTFGIVDRPQRIAPPAVDDASHAFGCAYVLEGASLGGAVIARHLRGRFGEGGVRFFVGHGAETGARWKAFLRRLEHARTAEPLDDMRAIRAAVCTFEHFEAALERAGALRDAPDRAAGIRRRSAR